MYESFYNLREKPFTLLPDPGFLYMSDKHRMAFTMLEYGLMNQAGFTVISGDIGAGKTTLIRHLLDNMDREHTVGLISNTHRSFGELLQWILLAFNLEHADMNKVEMYQRFVDFIIDEYAHNRRTVLIVDEAQNMDAETLEELRMLSNVNADKNQALQVVLVGQRELRDTLQRPDLVQFAQRISVDYHLQPLSEEETAAYIRHRVNVAGGDPDIFPEAACKAVYRYSNGVPRLINLLCDTALVYGYADQKQRLDVKLIMDVAREKQQGGIFPTFHPAELDEVPEPAAEAAQTGIDEPVEPEPAPLASKELEDPAPETPAAQENPVSKSPDQESTVTPDSTVSPPIHPATPSGNDDLAPEAANTTVSPTNPEFHQQQGRSKKKVRLALCSAQEGLRQYLSRLLESYGFEVVEAVPLNTQQLSALDPARFDVLLVDRSEDTLTQPSELTDILANWSGPVLYNDSTATEISLLQGNPDFGHALAGQINSLAAASGITPRAANHT
jgi:general secretion pathway protein A